jgi:alanine racemase
MQIATVGIGYADGLGRRLGNGAGKMLVNGKFAPIIGNVCMDMTMIDITEIPSREGDEVIIFGTDYTISQIAIDMGTIPYEVLTNISQRVKRIYFHE